MVSQGIIGMYQFISLKIIKVEIILFEKATSDAVETSLITNCVLFLGGKREQNFSHSQSFYMLDIDLGRK